MQLCLHQSILSASLQQAAFWCVCSHPTPPPCPAPTQAYDCVCQEAVEAASKLAARMLQHCPASVVTALQEAGAQLGIIGKGQLVTGEGLPAQQCLVEHPDS